MPYVRRDKQGNVTGVYAVMQPGEAEESVATDDPAVLAFEAKPQAPPSIANVILAAQKAIKTGDTTELDALAIRVSKE